MADPSSYPDSRPDHKSNRSTPRWVIVLGIIILILALLFVISQFIGGGGHGPGRHTPSSSVQIMTI